MKPEFLTSIFRKPPEFRVITEAEALARSHRVEDFLRSVSHSHELQEMKKRHSEENATAKELHAREWMALRNNVIIETPNPTPPESL